MSADDVFALANWTLVAALILGVLATYAVVVSGNIKEKELKRELSRANADAEMAKADAARANERAADANQKAAELNKRAATLEKEAEQARLETERLKHQISWRKITATQRRTIINALKEHPLSMDIVCVGSDPEACDYAQQIASVLYDSGSNPKFVKLIAAANNPSGLLIGGTGTELELLQSVFRAAGITFSAGREIQNLELRIGAKPHAQ